MHPPPGLTGCPEPGPAREERKTFPFVSFLKSCSILIFLLLIQAVSVQYLQLAVVQAGHWNLLHFHLPEEPDEQTLLWSCCSCSQHWPGQDCRAEDKEHKPHVTHSPCGQQLCVRMWCRLTTARWTRSRGVASHSYSLRATQNRESQRQKRLNYTLTDGTADVS